MKHEFGVKVRFSETDALGHVSNISYFIYLEDARIEFFRKLGANLGMGNWHFIVANVSCDFIQQAHFDDHITIESTVSKIGNTSFHIKHELYTDKGLVARGKAVVVYFDFEAQKPIPVPTEFKKALETYVEKESKEV
ncbi:thioesterase family protein [Bacillaceae bacterium S4-13-56]